MGLLINGAWVVKKEEEEEREKVEEEEDEEGFGGKVEQLSQRVRTVNPGGGPCSLGISHMDVKAWSGMFHPNHSFGLTWKRYLNSQCTGIFLLI